MNYVDGDPAHSSETTKAQKPLAAAEVQVEEVEGNPGYYSAKFFLRPHYQLEGLDRVAAAGVEAAVGQGQLIVEDDPVKRKRHGRTGACVMASDIFAKIGDIKGESLDDKHKDEIEVLSWSWGVSQTGTMAYGGGGGEGKANFNDFNFIHHVDKASPVLLQGVRDRRALQGSDDHGAQGRQGTAGVPDRQDERRPRHQRQSERCRRCGATVGERRAASSRRSISSTSRRRPTASLDAGVHFKYDLKGNKEG